MILPVSNLQTKSLKNKNFKQNVQHNYMNKDISSINSDISFKGREVKGRYYTDQEFADAAAGVTHHSDISDRYGFFKYVFTDAAEKHVAEVNRLREDLALEEKDRKQLAANEAKQADLAATRRRLAREAREAESRNDAALAKTEYLNNLSEKQNQLRTELCDKINMEKQGSHIEKMPNAIMIEDSYDDVSKELVDYTRRNSESRFIKLGSSDNDTLMDNLDETLKKAKAHFGSTKERTLVHVEGFDRLITRGQNSFENIDSLKDIMCRCAKDFGSTIIFRTKDASKLVSEAIEPHRVAIRVLANFKSVR